MVNHPNRSKRQLVRKAMDGLPMQPVLFVGEVIRFRQNGIVVAFLDAAQAGRRLNLHDIAVRSSQGEFSEAEQMQFAMLIGYSVSGFGDLSYADAAVIDRADEIAETIAQTRKMPADHPERAESTS